MQKVGEITHLAGSGRVIIRLKKALPEGQILCDEKNSRIAKVAELIGPVSSPFASAIPMTDKIKKYEGRSVFAPDTPAPTRGRKRR